MEPRRALLICGGLVVAILVLSAARSVYDATKPTASAAYEASLTLDAGPDLHAADEQGYLAASTFARDHRSVWVSLRGLPGAIVVFDAFLTIQNPTDHDRATLLDITLAGTPGSGSYSATIRDGQGAYLTRVGPAADAAMAAGGNDARQALLIPAHGAREIGFTYRALATAPDSGALLNADVTLAS